MTTDNKENKEKLVYDETDLVPVKLKVGLRVLDKLKKRGDVVDMPRYSAVRYKELKLVEDYNPAENLTQAVKLINDAGGSIAIEDVTQAVELVAVLDKLGSPVVDAHIPASGDEDEDDKAIKIEKPSESAPVVKEPVVENKSKPVSKKSVAK